MRVCLLRRRGLRSRPRQTGTSADAEAQRHERQSFFQKCKRCTGRLWEKEMRLQGLSRAGLSGASPGA